MNPSLSCRIARIPRSGYFIRFSSGQPSDSGICFPEKVNETQEKLKSPALEQPGRLSSSNSRTESRIRNVRINQLLSRMETAAIRTVRLRQKLADDREKLSSLGSLQTTLRSSKPSSFAKYPPTSTSLTISTLISATAHLGHNKALTSPTNYPLIYGTRSSISILDLRQTLIYLRRACNVVRETVQNDGIILFAHGIDGTQHSIKSASEKLGKNGYALGNRPNEQNGVWVRGTITNSVEVLKRQRQVAKQIHLKKALEGGAYNTRNQQSGNLDSMKFQPSLIIVFSPRNSRVLLREAGLKQIPTIGIIDSDVDARVVTYPIPANDDSVRFVELLAGVLARAGQDGLRRREQKLSRLMITGNDAKSISETPRV